jgi:hypothetical protein
VWGEGGGCGERSREWSSARRRKELQRVQKKGGEAGGCIWMTPKKGDINYGPTVTHEQGYVVDLGYKG